MAKKSDIEFQSIIRNEIEQSLGYYDTEYSQDRIQAMDYYLGEPFGNEQSDRSQVIATEVSDTIEHIMPSIMRIFTQSDDYVRFTPRGPEDVKKTEDASDYINWLVSSQNNGFQIFHNWFKDAMLLKLGIVKFYHEEKVDIEFEEYEGLTENELIVLVQDDAVTVVEQTETVLNDQLLNPDGSISLPMSVFDVKISRTTVRNKFKIENVPPEEYLMSKRAKSFQDADFVAHRTTMSVSDLVEMGYDQDEVERFAGYNDLDTSDERNVRFEDIESSTDYESADPAMRDVLFT